MTDQTALSATSLFKIFGRRPGEAIERLRGGAGRDQLDDATTAAVIDASFDVRRGEIFVVIGLSGSGKSTLIRMLNGLVEPSAGSVMIGGAPVTGTTSKRLRAVRRSKVSMVFQHFALLPHRTVLENVAYGLEIKGMSRAERQRRATETIELVGLSGWADKLPSQLSGGMQQRVGLARALAADTEVLLMDEAFSALDPLIRREMQEQLVELQSRLGKTIVFITHDLNEAMFLGDRIAVMRDGRIVQIGTPEDILTDPANDYVQQFVQDVDRARVLTAASVMERARAVLPPNAGPRAALRVMRDAQTSAAFAVGRDRHLRGIVLDRDALRLLRKGENSIDLILLDSYTAVSADAPLIDLVVPAIGTPLPIAVIDDAGRLLGVVPRMTLLAALGPSSTATDEITVLAPPLSTAVIDEALATDAMTSAPDGGEAPGRDTTSGTEEH